MRGMKALDCELWELGGSLNLILRNYDLKKNVNLRKVRILGIMNFLEAVNFGKLVSFGFAEFWEAECWKIVGFYKMCGMGL